MSQDDDMMLRELRAMARMYKRHGNEARVNELQTLIDQINARLEAEVKVNDNVSDISGEREDLRA